MGVTIKDIAKQLGISYSSVSRALNDKPGVAEDTRRKVMALAKQLEYQPNDLARGLVNKTSKTIGVIVPDISNPFYSEVVKGILETANKEKYGVLLCVSQDDPAKEIEYLNTLRMKRVDGIIVRPAFDIGIETYKDISGPVIMIEQNWKVEDSDYNVEVDSYMGGKLAGSHLLDCGYRNIGFIGGKHHLYVIARRLTGAKDALAEGGVPFDDENLEGSEFTIQGGYEATKRLLKRNPSIDGIFAVNDLLALGALHALKELGHEPGEDVGVIGYDDIGYSDLPQIQLTTIQQPKYALGKMVTEMLVDSIRNKGEYGKQITLSPTLIKRATTKYKTGE